MPLDEADLRELRRLAENLVPGVVRATTVEDEGVIVDVDLLTGEEEVPCRLGSSYTGPGFGLYVLPDDGDRVLVALPLGELEEATIVRFLDDLRAAPPGDEVAADLRPAPKKILLVGGPGHDLRVDIRGTVKLTASGNVRVEGAGNVELAVSDAALVAALDGVVTARCACVWGGSHAVDHSFGVLAEKTSAPVGRG